jgi:hypothetical protein
MHKWGVVMAASILASLLVGLLIYSTVRMRHRESRRDSIARFADAREAMSAIHGRTVARTAEVTPHPSDAGDSSNVVVQSGSATLLDPIARRRIDQTRKSYRTDPEVLARRPTVAMLPSLLTPHGEAELRSATPDGGTDAVRDAGTNMVSLPLPRSEAS